MYQNVEERKRACEKEKRAYMNFLSYIQIIRAVAREFDGKVINVKFQERLYERIKHYVKISFEEKYGYFKIEVYNSTLNHSHDYTVSLSVFDKTDSGKYRMNAERFCDYVSSVCGNELRKSIALFNTEEIESAREDFEKIANALKAFEEKYSYKVIEYAGCSFHLQGGYMSDCSLIY